MARLEELTPGAAVRGVLANGLVTVVSLQWFGDAVAELTYKDAAGVLGSELLYRDREPTLEVVEAGRPWAFDGDGALLRLVSEAHRIHLAHLFDPLLAVHTSLVEPLPHQITAVYGELLPRQPLRFLLADDPGAGKTIMTGLLIKELLIRGDLRRCLIVCPGSLVEQWQDELKARFDLDFRIVTRDAIAASQAGNPFADLNLAIARLDHLSRNDDLQAKLGQTDWDLIVCDEAHKLSATYLGDEVKYTRRYRLAQLLGKLTRHFLLLTATPHNGKEADFQLFMALLDGDRFEGRFRDGVHTTDAGDLMRRLVKEQLVTFDNTPLFPERRAAPVAFALSNAEAALYRQVTDYVREEFNRAEQLESDGRKGTVGFALTVLQRRLASSPEAIYQSLRRRRERLEARLREAQVLRRGASARLDGLTGLPDLTADDIDDLNDAPDAEVEAIEEQVVDQATAARTAAELEAELAVLRQLERQALAVRLSQVDRKWEALRDLLLHGDEMFDAAGARRKLVIFTEHRDTLAYLTERIRTALGRAEAVTVIHGGLGRNERKRAQDAFTQDRDTLILVATDAAGEGINLQRAHLMVNYDLPWNPNRLEQRFGRIHRIGQTEVCHLWNLVAHETREGEVYHRLLKKLDQERQALGGQVFDVLGKLSFDNRPLRELLLEAIRYGDQPEVKARLSQEVDRALDQESLRALLEERALARDSLDTTRVHQIRAEMERADAHRLQPHFIAAFFLEAFTLLGGRVHEREARRYEVTHVPPVVRQRDRQIGVSRPVLPRYERITFEKTLIGVPDKPLADLVCPGHPLLDAIIDLILERHRDQMKRGAVLVDPTDAGTEVRALFYLEHALQDGRTTRRGERLVVSRQLQFVALDRHGQAHPAGAAPYLDLRPATEAELAAVEPLLTAEWLSRDLEQQALAYAVTELVPPHLAEVRGRKEELVARARVAVHERLTKEMQYWDHRANQLRAQEEAGRTPKLNSALARRRADELETRLQGRMAELEAERRLAALPPVAIGGALVVPAGLLAQLLGAASPETAALAEARRRVERLAMDAVLATERALGYEPRDVGDQKLGYDVESRAPGSGRLRFIEVKGRAAGADTVTVTKNEILTALNKPDDFILALVEVDGDTTRAPRYVRQPFRREPDFGATSVIYALADLLSKAENPA
ncbi:MAG: DUF3883 domain-containing protein [Chloroflexi bacterium]|nr:DUF3883 domain-containing protein [Chloroflexota bacterium]